jgi:protein phosphatase
MISEDAIAEIISSSASLEEAAKHLIEAANENGGRDNITVILFRLEDADGEDADSDTLGDQATMAGVSAASVRAAVQDADAAPPRPSAARPGRDETRVGRTVEAGGVPLTSPIASRRAPPIPRRRRVFAAVGVLLVLLAAVAVVWVVDRQFWFVGTTDNGQVALYRGLPYELPLGINMYSQQRISAVPATSITDRRQRKYVLDHHARGHGDSLDLFEQIDSGSGTTP